jgi:hypothetical protein
MVMVMVRLWLRSGMKLGLWLRFFDRSSLLYVERVFLFIFGLRYLVMTHFNVVDGLIHRNIC